MLTANSSSVRMFEGPCRAAAAQARVLLMMAAAKRWDAAWEECDTQDGFVLFGKKKLRFGEVAAVAATLEPPAEPVYRASSADPLYGKELTRLDLPAKIDGSANYAGDIRLPDMVFAAIRQGPLGATRLKAIDRKTRLGLARACSTSSRTIAGSPTVARNWWAANRALDRFAPVFETEGAPISTDRIDKALQGGAEGRRLSHEQRRRRRRSDVGPHEDRCRICRRAGPARTHRNTHRHCRARRRAGHASGSRRRHRRNAATRSQPPPVSRRSNVVLFPMMAGGSFDACLDHSVAVQAAIIALRWGARSSWSGRAPKKSCACRPRAPARARLTATLNAAGGIDALGHTHRGAADQPRGARAPVRRHARRRRATRRSGERRCRRGRGRGKRLCDPAYGGRPLPCQYRPADRALARQCRQLYRLFHRMFRRRDGGARGNRRALLSHGDARQGAAARALPAHRDQPWRLGGRIVGDVARIGVPLDARQPYRADGDRTAKRPRVAGRTAGRRRRCRAAGRTR